MLHVTLLGLACLVLTTSCAEPAVLVREPVEPVFRTRRQWDVDGKPEHVLAADLDGDGHAELVAALQRGALVHRRGSAEGLEREHRTLSVGAWPLRPLALPAGSFGAAPGQRLVAVASRAKRTLILHDLSGAAQPREIWRGHELSTPRTMAVGDLGADGTLEVALTTDGRELVVIGENGSTTTHRLAHDLPRCSTFLADGSGIWVGFQDAQMLELVAGARREIALAGIPRDVIELDLDGVTGLLVVGGDEHAWMFGPDGTPFLHWSTGSIPIDVESADLDGNGSEDVAVLTLYGLSYELGPRRPVQGYAGQTPTSLALADLTGDGAVDLAIANRDARAVSIVHGDGQGGVHDAIQIPVGTTPTTVVAGQLVGDPRPEIVTLNAKSQTASVLVNEGGVLRAMKELSVGPSPRAALITSLDGETNEVVLIAQDARGAWVESLHPAAGKVRRRVRSAAFGRSGAALCELDLTGDGAGLTVADPDDGSVLGLRLPAGARDVVPEPVFLRAPIPSSPVALAAVELDGDALPELAVALGAPGPRVGVALLDFRPGAGGFAAFETGLVDTAGWPLDVAVANLNDDGRDDLVVLALAAPGAADGLVQTFLGSADAPGFVAGAPLPTGARPHHLAVGDVDGDGLDDVFVDSQNAHVVNGWLTRAGADGVRLQRLDDIGAHLGCYDVELADVNGDGRVDLLVANSFSDDVSVILNLPR